jgi:hypothetical protein
MMKEKVGFLFSWVIWRNKLIFLNDLKEQVDFLGWFEGTSWFSWMIWRKKLIFLNDLKENVDFLGWFEGTS